MRERKCIVVGCGGVIVARVIERVYGEARWLMVEEHDVTAGVAALLPKPSPEDGGADVAPADE